MARALWKDNPSIVYDLLRRITSLHRPVQLLNCAAIVMQCLLLAGCAGPNALAGTYLFDFGLVATDATRGFSHLEIRVGYFYLCTRLANNTNWICGNPDRVREELMGVAEPWNLARTAYDLRDRAVSPSMNIISLASSLLAVFSVSSFPLLRESDESDIPTSRNIWWLKFALVATSGLGMTSGMLAAVWQHTVAATAASLMKIPSQGAVVAASGSVATALVWLTFLVSLVTGCLCLSVNWAMNTRQLDHEDLYSVTSRSLVSSEDYNMSSLSSSA